MNSKQQAIEKAYGYKFNSLIDENGWAIQFNTKFTESGIESFGDYETRCHIDGSYAWRPKSLSGIENNNGWIKIESEDDLPTDENLSYFHYHFPSKERMEALSVKLETYSCQEIKNLYLAGFCTHYQPIQKPVSPIY